MTHRELTTAILLVTLLLQGCVAPGSSIGNVWVRGEVMSEARAPLPEQKVHMLLPATYGLGGLDLVLNQPGDFGQEDEWFVLRTDENGQFEQDLGTRVYHVSCWILPPVGCYPKAPPAPFVVLRIAAAPDQVYAIQTGSGEYRIFTQSGEEISLEQSRASEITASSEIEQGTELRATRSTIRVRLKEE